MHNDDPGTQVDIPLKPINFERNWQKWSNSFEKSVKHWSKSYLNICQRKRGEQGNLCIKIKKKSWKIDYYFSYAFYLMISTKFGKMPAFKKLFMLQKNRKNCKESKENKKVQRRSQVNTLTIASSMLRSHLIPYFFCQNSIKWYFKYDMSS